MAIKKLPGDTSDMERAHMGGDSHGGMWLYNGHVVKRSRNPVTEGWVSKLFQLTKTPGAIWTRSMKGPSGKYYSVSEKLHGVKPLKNANDNDFYHHGSEYVGNLLLSEYLAGVRDRHGGNYLVSSKGIHSIDHDYSGEPHVLVPPGERRPRPGVFRFPSLLPFDSRLHERFTSFGITPMATKEHLDRWERVINDLKRVPKSHSLNGMHERLEHAKRLVDFTGRIPVGDLTVGNGL